MSNLPVTVYTPESPVRHPVEFLRTMVRDWFGSRELAWRLFIRDLNAQYRQTMLGYVWAFVPPLAASATFIFLNSQGIVKVSTTGIPYPAFAMMGTLLWQGFVDAIQCPGQAVVQARPMLAKINFPREAILLGGLYMVLFNLCIRLLLIVAVMLWWQIVPSTGLLFFPVAMAALVAGGFAIGLAITPLSALFNDFGRGLPVLAQFWMLLTPVVYPTRVGGLAGWLATWNPVSPLITTARECLTGQALTMVPEFTLVFTLSLLAVFIGLAGYRLAMPVLIERMGG